MPRNTLSALQSSTATPKTVAPPLPAALVSASRTVSPAPGPSAFLATDASRSATSGPPNAEATTSASRRSGISETNA
jgi:hypothetical protein